jgi:uncharacterized protein with HEPN domain
MPRDPRLYLWDIEQAITNIADQTKDRSFIEYSAERFVRQVVERNFEIIGEALVRLARHFPVEIEKIQHYRQFISFRNVIAHQYDGINDAIVWQTATVSLPLLKEQVIAMREALGTP